MPDLPNSADIRQFLNDICSDEELVIFCYDYFREAHNAFTDEFTKARKIQHLIEYCERRAATPSLLAALQRARPEQYLQQFPHAPRAAIHYEPARPLHDPKQVFISYSLPAHRTQAV
jgi:hypothetical protein